MNQYICKIHGDDIENLSFGDKICVSSEKMNPLQVAKILSINAGKKIDNKIIPHDFNALSETEKWVECEMIFNEDKFHIVIEKEWQTITIDIEKVYQDFICIDELEGR